jgi:monoamine oxidase
MMLECLGVKNVDIFEATGQVGGRCATKKFSEKESKACPHNYYDMGAMRIPEIKPMASTLNLIQKKELLNIGSKLRDYVYLVSSGSGEGEVYYEPTCHWGNNSGKSQPE